MLTTTAFRALQRQSEQREERERQRREALIAQRPTWAGWVADEARVTEELAEVRALLAEEIQRHNDAMAPLQAAVSSFESALRDVADSKRLLIDTAPDFVGRPLKRYARRLEAAHAVVKEPEPAPPSGIAGMKPGEVAPGLINLTGGQLVPAAELLEGHERRLAAYMERVSDAGHTIATLTPLVEALTALAMTPDPTEAEVAAILGEDQP